jgi:hypothetical protein
MFASYTHLVSDFQGNYVSIYPSSSQHVFQDLYKLSKGDEGRETFRTLLGPELFTCLILEQPPSYLAPKITSSTSSYCVGPILFVLPSTVATKSCVKSEAGGVQTGPTEPLHADFCVMVKPF